MTTDLIVILNYINLGFGYEFNEHFLARLNVSNLFDTSPPQMADAVNGNNTDTGMYDIFGRTYHLSLSAKF